MTEKQQQLLFDKGITNVPSDVLCSDNTLAESVGLVYENGEHRVIQKPKAYMTSAVINISDTDYAGELIIIHRFNDVLRHIIRVTEAGDYKDKLYCKIVNDDSTVTSTYLGRTMEGEITAETIGNTLVLSNADGMNYLLWDYAKGQYKNLGTKIPDIQMRFAVTDAGFLGISNITGEPDPSKAEDLDPNTYAIIPGLEGIGLDNYGDVLIGTGNKWSGNNGHEEGKAGLIGLVASRLNWVKQRKRFAFPFWARSAVRLYDGSHINVSNPFLLLPSVSNNWHIFCCTDTSPYTPRPMNSDAGGNPITNYMPLCAKLNCNTIIPSDVTLSDWEDIISGVDIFVSEEVKTFDMEGSWKIINIDSIEQDPNKPYVATADACASRYGIKKEISKYTEHDVYTIHTYYKPSLLSEGEIIDRLVQKSVFYKIVELDRDELESYTAISLDTTTKIDRNALLNLTTQTQLESDDYFSRSDLVPNVIKTYNSRLHMADAWRGFFNGFERFSYTSYETGGSTEKHYYFFVHIKAEDGERVVCSEAGSYEIYDVWFYYPDPRAYQVDVYIKDGQTYKKLSSFSLKEHSYLHGAYHFGHLPTTGETFPSGTTVQNLPATVSDMELLEGQVLVSEVNNPWLFKAEGYVKVGMGRIIGLASQTVALGQEEHGIHPLVVFSERGISTLRLNNEGVYIRSDELSREVCCNRKSITETDGAVFFVSKKGLMVLVGNQVKCVSEQLSGLADSWAAEKVETGFGNYAGFFANCFIAYDYRDSLLWLFDGVTRTVTGQNNTSVDVFGLTHCLIYSIKSSTFTKMKPLDSIITKVINNYPDYILESGSSLYSLKNRNSVNADSAAYSAKMLTRPMKLENALALKSIMEIRNMGHFSTNIGIKLEIYASNNLKDWVKLTSLRGTPWLYYRFLYTFTNLFATDRFAGAVLVTQERRTDKLRFMPARYTHITMPDPSESQDVRPEPTPEPTPTPTPAPTPPPAPEPTPDPDPEPLPEYTYHANVDPRSIVIPEGSSSVTQTIYVYNTRQAAGQAEESCELYVKIWKRVGTAYTQLYGSSGPVSSAYFTGVITDDTDAVVVCVNTTVINTPSDYVDREEISVGEPIPTPGKGDVPIDIVLNNVSNEDIYITGLMRISVQTASGVTPWDWAPINIKLDPVSQGSALYKIPAGRKAEIPYTDLIYAVDEGEPISKYYGGSIYYYGGDPVYWRVYSWTTDSDPAVVKSEPGAFNFTSGGSVVFNLTRTDQEHEGQIVPSLNPVVLDTGPADPIT